MSWREKYRGTSFIRMSEVPLYLSHLVPDSDRHVPPLGAFPEQPTLRPVHATASEHQGKNSHVKRFRGGLVFKAHRLLYHSTLGLRVIKKKKKKKEQLT